MKIKTLLILALGFMALSLSVVAQPSAPVESVAIEEVAASQPVAVNNVVTWLTPILVPLLIAGVKKVRGSIPSWVLPILAPVLGILIELVQSLATSHSGNFLLAALLGLAGVGLREVKENIKPAPNGGWPASNP